MVAGSHRRVFADAGGRFSGRQGFRVGSFYLQSVLMTFIFRVEATNPGDTPYARPW